MLKKSLYVIMIFVFLSCGKETIESETESTTDEIVVEEEQEETPTMDEEGTGEESEENTPKINFDISILVRNIDSDDNFLIDYLKGEETQSIATIQSLETVTGSRLPFFFDNIGNELFFYQRTPQRDVLKINLESKEFQNFTNTDGLTDEQLFASVYRIFPTPTQERIVTMDSHNPSGIGNDTIFYNSLRIYNQLTQELEIMELPDEDRISIGFSNAKSNGELYMYQNVIEQENGSFVDEWKIVDLALKEVVAEFDLYNDDKNFSWFEQKIYFSDGKTFNIDLNDYAEDLGFPFDLGSPNMVDAQIKNNQIFFKAASVVKDGLVDNGIVFYDFSTKESKKILERELLLTTFEYFNDQETRYQEILQAHYDFDSGIIALTSSNDNPNYAVIFLDFDLNILKVQTFSGYRPLKIMGIEN